VCFNVYFNQNLGIYRWSMEGTPNASTWFCSSGLEFPPS
jgi:hypothetical protein